MDTRVVTGLVVLGLLGCGADASGGEPSAVDDGATGATQAGLSCDRDDGDYAWHYEATMTDDGASVDVACSVVRAAPANTLVCSGQQGCKPAPASAWEGAMRWRVGDAGYNCIAGDYAFAVDGDRVVTKFRVTPGVTSYSEPIIACTGSLP